MFVWLQHFTVALRHTSFHYWHVSVQRTLIATPTVIWPLVGIPPSEHGRQSLRTQHLHQGQHCHGEASVSWHPTGLWKTTYTSNDKTNNCHSPSGDTEAAKDGSRPSLFIPPVMRKWSLQYKVLNWKFSVRLQFTLSRISTAQKLHKLLHLIQFSLKCKNKMFQRIYEQVYWK